MNTLAALLHSMELPEQPAETGFDAIARLAAQVTGRSIARIGLVTADRRWFKHASGWTPRSATRCARARTSAPS